MSGIRWSGNRLIQRVRGQEEELGYLELGPESTTMPSASETLAVRAECTRSVETKWRKTQVGTTSCGRCSDDGDGNRYIATRLLERLLSFEAVIAIVGVGLKDGAVKQLKSLQRAPIWVH